MNLLNLYFSITGNTEKIANQIENTAREAGHQVDSLKITKELDVDLLHYDFLFIGSGVYRWLPGRPMLDFISRTLKKYAENGNIKPSAPRVPDKRGVVYCTYGGVHTGVNEAIPAVKYMGQLFDHLGIEIVGEWYIVGEYLLKKHQGLSTKGRLGDIVGRPNSDDLKRVAEMVRGILRV
ncbi:MAG: flavodoxin [Nitrospiraceae bacterium]|nr:flavodoxin [Nitrospiraceae bacterium]